MFYFSIEFIEQFEIVPVRTSKERTSLKKEELYFGSSFEPSSVYKMLSKIRSETFKVEGRQEDAEEFLSCLLNGLHDELLEAIKSIRAIENSPSPVAEVRHSSSDDGDWQVNNFHGFFPTTLNDELHGFLTPLLS